MCDLIITDAAVLFPDDRAQQSDDRDKSRKDMQCQTVSGDRLETAAKERITGTGKLVMPGLADCHMHTGSSS